MNSDFDVVIGSVAEVPQGLDKLRDAFAKATADGINDGAVMALNKGIGGIIKQLGGFKLSSKNYEDVLKAALTVRTYTNAAAAVARHVGVADIAYEAATNQESINRIVRTSRGFPQLVTRTQKERDREAAREQRDIERKRKQDAIQLERQRKEDARQLAREQKEQAALLKQEEIRQDYAASELRYNTQAEALYAALEEGSITKDDAKDALRDLRVSAGRVKRDLRRSGASQRVIDEQTDILIENDRHFVKEIGMAREALEENTVSLNDMLYFYRTAIAAGAGGIALGNFASNTMAAYYGNRKTPFTELRHTMANVEQCAGGVTGAVVGAAIGSIVPVIGTAIGAAVGGLAGSWLGGQEKRRQQAAESSQLDAIEQRRWRSLYANTDGWQFAKLAEATGFTTAVDMESFASTANTFLPAAAFGGVSDSQWLALSMMPNYYAAMVAGADESTRLRAYQSDMAALGPGMGQYFSQMAGVPEGIRALATSGHLGRLTGDVGFAADMERELDYYSDAYINAQYTRRREDIRSRRDAWRAGADRTDPFKYDPYGYSVDESPTVMARYTLNRLNFREFENGRAVGDAGFTRSDIHIYLDNERAVTLEGVWTDDKVLESYITYSAGSIL